MECSLSIVTEIIIYQIVVVGPMKNKPRIGILMDFAPLNSIKVGLEDQTLS